MVKRCNRDDAVVAVSKARQPLEHVGAVVLDRRLCCATPGLGNHSFGATDRDQGVRIRTPPWIRSPHNRSPSPRSRSEIIPRDAGMWLMNGATVTSGGLVGPLGLTLEIS
jgi:hypothetical protein